jgi:hypothetical protein
MDTVLARINTYSASINFPVTAVEFGEGSLPAPPYVVVTQEQNQFRINTHVNPGMQPQLRLFVRKHLQEAFQNVLLTGTDGAKTMLHPDDPPIQIVGNNDDGTISQERLFRVADGI